MLQEELEKDFLRSPAEEAKYFLASIVESSRDSIVTVDFNGIITTWNKAAENLYGYPAKEAIGKSLTMLTLPEDLNKILGNIDKIKHSKEVLMFQTERVGKDNDHMILEMVMSPVKDEAGTVVGVSAVARDVTEHKRAEEATYAFHIRTTEILESISDIFYAVDKDFNFTFVNQKAEEVWKLCREDLIGKHFWTEFPQAVGSESYKMHLKVMSERQPVHYETLSPIVQKWISVNIYPSENGGLAVYFQDIQDRKQAEEAVRSSEEKYRTLFDSMDEAYSVVEVLADENGAWNDFLFLEVNPAFIKHTGMEYPVGRRATEILGTPNPHWAQIYGQVATTGEAVRFEEREETLDRIFDLYVFRLGGEGSRRVAVLFTDITERKRTEANLAFLAEVSRDLVQMTNIDETMSPLCAKIGEHFNVARVVFAEIGEDETSSVIRHEWRQDGLPTLKEAAALKNLLTHKLEAAQRDGDIAYIKDVATELRDAALTLTELGIASLLGAPLVRHGNLHLYLSILHSEPREWRKDELELMRELTSLIRTRLERARAEEALLLGEAQLQVLLDETPMGVYLLDADFRISAVNPTALPVFGEIPDLIGRDFDEVIHRLWSKEYADEVVRLFRHTLETGEPYYTPERIEERLDLGVTEYYEWNITRIPLPDGRSGVACYFRDVSAQVFARLEIAASEEKYRTLYESIDEGFCTIEVLFDDAGKAIDYLFIEANPAFARHLGVENAIGKRIREFAPTHEEFWFETYGQIAKTGEAKRFEHEAAALGKFYDVYAFRIGEPSENRVAVIFNDISERKRQEAELAELNAQIKRQSVVFNTTLSTITDFAYTFDRDGRFIYANRGLCDLLEISSEEIVGKNFFDLNYPDDLAAKLQRQIQEVFDTGETVRDETPFTNPAGADGFYEYIFSPFTAAAGSVEFVAGSTRDVTERRNAEESIRFQAHLLNTVEQAVIATDLDTKVIYWNQFAEKLYGWTAKEAIGRRIMELNTPDIMTEQANEIMSQVYQGKSWSGEFQVRHRDGTIFPAQVFNSPIEDGQGNLIGVVGVSIDITERKRAEEALAESEERLRLLIESASDYAIFTLTPDNLIDSWNTGAERVFGWMESEAIGQSGEIIFTPEDREKGAPEQEIETALQEGRAPNERFHIRKDGSRFFASGVMTVLKYHGDEVQGFVKIARDMTEQIEAEKALRDKELLQKLVGAQETERKRIARDLHDELGQQLTALRLKLDAVRKLCEGDELCGKIDDIELLAKSIDHGVDFLAWELRPAALDDLGLVPALEHYVNQWSHHSGVTAELISTTLKNVRFEPEVETNLYRIVQEALNNTHKHAKAKGAEVMLEWRDGLLVMLIEDNGVGFNPKDKKNPLRGIGLIGMRERAQIIGGTLEIESAPGRGTTVYVRVPAEAVNGNVHDEK